MAIPRRQQFPSIAPGFDWLVTDDGSRTLVNRETGETFHSGCGAVAETLAVYLHNSGVAKRLLRQEPTSVLEYGFGTGLAFLLTSALAEIHSSKLKYRALENEILTPDIYRELKLAEALRNLSPIQRQQLGVQAVEEFTEVVARLSESLCGAIDQFGADRSDTWVPLSDCVALKLSVGDARVTNLRGQGAAWDAVYFDPFCPENCPELWCSRVYETVFEQLKPGAGLVSYCVKSSVRRELESTGFVVEKLSGPEGGKREVLRAIKPVN